jgi:type VI secretion system Hcp family effector
MMTRKAKLTAVAAGACAVVLGLSVPPAWAENAFAKITGRQQGVIKGDQIEIRGLPGSKDAIQVFSTTFGLQNPPVPVGGGGGGGKAVAGPVAVVKGFDAASPKLLRAAFTGEALTVEITWFMANSQAAPQKTVTIKLDGAAVTNMEASAQLSGGFSTDFESVSFTYSRITFTTPIINPVTGAVTGTSSVCLDVASNRTC